VSGIFKESPWQNIPLYEPVAVQAGKHYEVGIDTETGKPYVREAAQGLVFPSNGTIHGLLMMEPPAGAAAVYHASRKVTDQYECQDSRENTPENPAN